MPVLKRKKIKMTNCDTHFINKYIYNTKAETNTP